MQYLRITRRCFLVEKCDRLYLEKAYCMYSISNTFPYFNI